MHLDKPMPLLKEPINCSWCSRKLQGHVQRRNGNLYCNDTCSNQGEERRLRYVAALAGTVNSHYLIGACALIIFMVAFTLFGGSKAFAHDPNTHLADGYAHARSKKGTLCCDGTDYTHIKASSWERTDKGFRVRVHNAWVEVPADAEVGNMRNPDGEAKVWLYFDGDKPHARCFMVGIES
jgi:hypothetical protein